MDLTSFVIIGAIVSLIVEIIKTYAGTDYTKTLISVVVISIVAGTAYSFMKDTSYWQSIVSILGFAGAVYTFLIKRFEK